MDITQWDWGWAYFDITLCDLMSYCVGQFIYFFFPFCFLELCHASMACICIQMGRHCWYYVCHYYDLRSLATSGACFTCHLSMYSKEPSVLYYPDSYKCFTLLCSSHPRTFSYSAHVLQTEIKLGFKTIQLLQTSCYRTPHMLQQPICAHGGFTYGLHFNCQIFQTLTCVNLWTFQCI